MLVGAGGFVAADRLQSPDSELARTVASAELDTLASEVRHQPAWLEIGLLVAAVAFLVVALVVG